MNDEVKVRADVRVETASDRRGVEKEKATAGNKSDGARLRSRRKFLGHVSGAAAVAATVGGLGLEPLLGGKRSSASAQANFGGPGAVRADEALFLRERLAQVERRVAIPPHTTNGDEQLYADKSNSYSKCLVHDNLGQVDLNSFHSLRHALKTGEPADFEEIILGGQRKQNGPQGGFAFDLEGTDAYQFGAPLVPPAPALASDWNAAELVELYWASLLRDVPFTQYETNATVAQAAAELSGLQAYQGPRVGGQVTPGVLFRGGFPGELLGPYISQFFIKPTAMGAQPITQLQTTYMPNLDYGADFATWLDIQNGVDTGLRNQVDPQLRCMHNGRDLGAWTHVDVLYQGYFAAYLVLSSIGAPVNPGSPYVGSKTQQGFGTFGGPDFVATLAEVATRALKAVWFQKWQVHLRSRPEATGGLVHLIKSGQGGNIQGKLSNVILNSQALQQSFAKYGTWLLSLAFPEGSPAHPAYPTGHGTVGGACITVLKFFFDGNFVIPNPVVTSDDGLSLLPYTGADAGALTVNGELNKLGHNVSYGHGIHPGIHWRSDTDISLLLGEAVALAILQDRARTYNEKFTVQLTKFDGTTATISNE
ncbi:MAG TPA: vanadium-dependent haloperoxidase [Candidatus Acidoferrum sp.]|nr:vanadium-dependent haloperoxidase [Candidatus Acidoferrum sp.]